MIVVSDVSPDLTSGGVLLLICNHSNFSRCPCALLDLLSLRQDKRDGPVYPNQVWDLPSDVLPARLSFSIL